MANDSDTDTKTETAKVGGKELTWGQLVKKMGTAKAAKAAPELDPRYKSLVASEGQAKGSADYSHKYIDPQTNIAKGYSGLGSASQIEEGIGEEKKQGGLLPSAEGDIGSFIMSEGGLKGGGGIGQALFGGSSDDGSSGADPSKPKAKAAPKKAAGPAPTPPAEALMNGLIGQYQSAMGTVDPYMNGTVSGLDSTKAQQIGQGIAAGAVEQPNAAASSVLGADAAAYTKANDAGAAGIQNALKDTGQADQQYLQVSPYLGLLNALQSEATYKAETAGSGGSTGISLPKGSPSWLGQAYQALNTGTGATGVSTPGAVTQPSSSATSPTTNTDETAGGGNG